MAEEVLKKTPSQIFHNWDQLTFGDWADLFYPVLQVVGVFVFIIGLATADSMTVMFGAGLYVFAAFNRIKKRLIDLEERIERLKT